ncbi:hypothetical protein M9Y10_005496 [Tritrichomonas musculus]|uniref:Intimal thickness related receptor IRP domain-containing protein n=1 Tax=Tritrichomonas musculus TaxID=1915356 RepID=A0ABR2JCB8_9EUKA
MDFPTYEDNRPFLYERSGILVKVVSLFFFLFALTCLILYTASNFNSAIETLNLTGNRVTTQNNQSYLILTVPKIKDNQIFSVFFLDFSTTTKGAAFDIDTDVSCQVTPGNNKRIYFQTNSTGNKEGSYRIFSTDYFKYDFFTIQAWLTGNISLIKDVNIRILQSYPEFGEKELKFRIVFSICCCCCLIGYIVSIILFTKSNTRFEQYLSLTILILATLSNFPFSFTKHTQNSFVFHSIENLLRGAFPAFNLVSLYCISYLANGGENVYTIFTILILFVLAEAMSEFTDDCCVIGHLFYGNYVVWIFFISASIISKITLSSLLIWNVINYFFCKSGRIKAKANQKCEVFIIYIALIIIQILPIAIQAIIFINQNCGNNTFDFFQQYMIQTLFALIFANIHWPVFSSKVEKLPLNSLEFESEEIRLDVDALSAEVTAEVSAEAKSDNSDHA